MHTAFSFTTLSASGTRFRMLPNACAKMGAVLLAGFHEAPSTATGLEDVLYLSLESSIESSNNDRFASVSHHLTELHDVWELQEAQKQQVQEEGAALRSRSSRTCPGTARARNTRARLPVRK